MQSQPKYTPRPARKYIGPQVQTRRAFGEGMYVFRGMPAKAAAVTGFFLHPQPPGAKRLSPLQRWNEYDWEFVPCTSAPQIQHSESVGAFPNQRTTHYRSRGHGHFEQVEGEYTDDEFASQVAVALTPERLESVPVGSIQTWRGLVANTGPSGLWPHADGKRGWVLPPHLSLPSRDILEHSVAITAWRTPYGTKTITVGNTTGTFIPTQDRHTNGYTHHLTEFVWATDGRGKFTFDPYNGCHDYTIVLSNDSVDFYIDAPDGGRDVTNANPVRSYCCQDYPSLEGVIAHEYPGGEAKRWYYGIEKELGKLLMIMNVHNSCTAWPGGTPSGPAKAYVECLAFYPPDGHGGHVFSGPDSFEFKFSSLTLDSWRYHFQKNFVVQMSELWCPDLVGWEETSPTGNPALSLTMVKHTKLPQRSYFILAVSGDETDPNTLVHAELDIPGVCYASMTYGSGPDAVFWPHGPAGSGEMPMGDLQAWKVEEPSRVSHVMIRFIGGLQWEAVGGRPPDWLGGCRDSGFICILHSRL